MLPWVYIVPMIVSAINPRVLGSTIAFCFAIGTGVDDAQVAVLSIFYLASVIIASFRD